MYLKKTGRQIVRVRRRELKIWMSLNMSKLVAKDIDMDGESVLAISVYL